MEEGGVVQAECSYYVAGAKGAPNSSKASMGRLSHCCVMSSYTYLDTLSFIHVSNVLLHVLLFTLILLPDLHAMRAVLGCDGVYLFDKPAST